MKKKYAIFTVIIFILLVTIFTYFSTLKQNNIYKEESIKSTKITKGISMMLEQNSGAGDYKLVTQSGWPTDGYILNTELSRCENGSTLNWDDTKKVVIVSGNLSDKCYVYFDKVFTLASYVISQYTGTQGANNIYYHNSSLSNGAGDNSYRYAGGDYVLTEKATTVGMKSLTSSSNTATDGITNFYCDGERLYLHDYNLYEYCDTNSSTYYFTLQYDTSNTQYQTYNEALEKAVSDGYLTKDNVKNFVCFGSNISPCPVENLYRVIGVIDNKVKLIKYDYATSALLGEDGAFNETYTLADTGTEPMYRGSLTTLDHYYWNNDTGTNTRSESDLNKINLNTNFINNIGSAWANKIATTTWKVGGNTYANIKDVVPATAYQNEVVNPTSGSYSTTGETTYEAKIGLMYVSDYGFAASSSAWTTTLYNYDGYDDNNVAIKDTNWMFIGSDIWTISRIAEISDRVFYVESIGFKTEGTHGDISGIPVNNNGGSGVNVVFFLNSFVTYVSGSGTMSDPIIID